MLILMLFIIKIVCDLVIMNDGDLVCFYEESYCLFLATCCGLFQIIVLNVIFIIINNLIIIVND